MRRLSRQPFWLHTPAASEVVLFAHSALHDSSVASHAAAREVTCPCSRPCLGRPRRHTCLSPHLRPRSTYSAVERSAAVIRLCTGGPHSWMLHSHMLAHSGASWQGTQGAQTRSSTLECP